MLVARLPSNTPKGKAHNLIVLVHGCCTDANGVEDFRELRDTIKQELESSKPDNDKWEIVVWDWSDLTPPLNPIKAYQNAKEKGNELGMAIAAAKTRNNSSYYTYIHSSVTALAQDSSNFQRRSGTITHLLTSSRLYITFLDAFTPTRGDKDTYGLLADYPHFSEHYVDRCPSPTSFRLPYHSCVERDQSY